MLWNAVIPSIRNQISNIIISTRQFIMYYIEGATVIVINQICNIFKEYNPRFFCIDDSHDLKKQISSFVIETLLFSANGKRLTRKSCSDYINIRQSLGIKAANIVFNQIASWKIISVCNTSSLVHLVGKSNLKPRLHESNINSSNTGKQTANSKNTHIILLHPPRFRQ